LKNPDIKKIRTGTRRRIISDFSSEPFKQEESRVEELKDNTHTPLAFCGKQIFHQSRRRKGFSNKSILREVIASNYMKKGRVFEKEYMTVK
jgi:hypothetical protein